MDDGMDGSSPEQERTMFEKDLKRFFGFSKGGTVWVQYSTGIIKKCE